MKMKILRKILPASFNNHLDQMKKSPLRYRLVKGTFWSFSGAIISYGAGLVSSIIVARVLGKQGFGEFGIIQSTVNMFGIFAGFGLGITATKYVAEFYLKDIEKTGRIIALSILFAAITGGLMAFLLIIISPWLAKNILAAPHLVGLIRISSGLLFLEALNGVQRGILSGFEAFKTIARRSFFSGLITLPMMVFCVYWAGIQGAVIGLLLNSAVNGLLNYMALHKEIKKAHISISFKGSLEEINIIWNFSLPAVLSSAMVMPVQWICNAILVNQPRGYSELGVFLAVNQFFTMITLLYTIFGNVFLPILVSIKEDGHVKFEYFNTIFPWGLGLAIALPLTSFPEIYFWIYGASFQGTYWNYTIAFCFLSAAIIAQRQGVARSFMANNLLWFSVLSNLFWGVISITSISFFCVYGAAGLAGSYCIAYIGNTIVFIPFYIRKRLMPKDLLYSKWAMLIWVCALAVSLTLIFHLPLGLRVINFFMCCWVIAICFLKLWYLEK